MIHHWSTPFGHTLGLQLLFKSLHNDHNTKEIKNSFQMQISNCINESCQCALNDLQHHHVSYNNCQKLDHPKSLSGWYMQMYCDKTLHKGRKLCKFPSLRNLAKFEGESMFEVTFFGPRYDYMNVMIKQMRCLL